MRHQVPGMEAELKQLEERVGKHDADIRTIVKAIRELMEPPAKSTRQIGFRIEEPKISYRVKRK